MKITIHTNTKSIIIGEAYKRISIESYVMCIGLFHFLFSRAVVDVCDGVMKAVYISSSIV